jgi:malate synthase
MARMAEVVDAQNNTTAGYVPMSTNLKKSLAYQAARELIVAGKEQPNGYTEPVLHHYRCLAKAATN